MNVKEIPPPSKCVLENLPPLRFKGEGIIVSDTVKHLPFSINYKNVNLRSENFVREK